MTLFLGVVIMFSTFARLYQVTCLSLNLVQPQDPPCFFNPLCTCSTGGGSPNMGHVQCHDVHMSVVPSSINQSVIYILSLRRNGLLVVEERAFAGTGMIRLEIADNLISGLSAGALFGLERTLRELNLAHNRLTSIPASAISGLKRLKQLNLNDNFISELRGETDFSPNLVPTLKTLLLSGNSLTFLDQYSFKNLKSLEHLDLSGNNIYSLHELSFLMETVSVEGPPPGGGGPSMGALVTLNLSDNRLTKLPYEAIKNLTSLKILDLRSNLITSTFEGSFSEKRLSLHELHLQENRIRELRGNSFAHFLTINRTFLSYNPLEHIFDEPFSEVSISYLDLTGCQLKSVSFSAWSGLDATLKGLDLSLNGLTPPPGPSETLFYNDSFNTLENLRSFTFDGNGASFRLSPLSLVSSQYTLQELSLRNTPQIMKTPFSPVKYEMHFPNMRRLGVTRLLTGNRLTRADLLGFGDHNLEALDVSGSSLEEISGDAFESTPFLKSLNLSNNSIRKIDDNSFRPIGRSLVSIDLRNSLGASTKTLFCEQLFNDLPSLVTINLGNNDLQGFSQPNHCFSNLKKLIHLNLDFNSIKSINSDLFNCLPQIVTLFLSFNKLVVIEFETFSELENLVVLDLSYNFIRRLKSSAFTNLKSLRFINLQGNDIQTIDPEAFLNVPNLQRLDLSYNRLTAIQLDSFDQMGILATLSVALDHNLINLDTNGSLDTSAQWPPFNSVETLDLSYNNISGFNGSFFSSIRNSVTVLLLNHNRLHSLIPSMVSSLRHLQKLVLSSNQIELVLPEVFGELYSLQVLYMSGNLISDLPSDAFRDTVNLRELNLSSNEIRGLPGPIFRKNPNLEILDLSFNRLTSLPSISLRYVSSSLRVLNCHHNQIRFLRVEDFEGTFPRLLALDLSANQVNQLPDTLFEGLPQLTRLDVSRNPLKVISDRLFDGLRHSLEELNLAFAHLINIPILNLPALRVLNLAFNLISYPNSISLTNVSGLRVFDVSGNRLTTVPNNLWHLLTRLQVLDISGNPIQTLANDSFIGLDRLERLMVTNLSLQNVQYGALRPLSALKALAISTYPSVKRFSVGKLIGETNSLREVTIFVNGSELRKSSLSPPALPKKLRKVTITGSLTMRLDEDAFSLLDGDPFLHLSITGTNVTFLSPALLSNLGRTRRLSLHLRDNALSSVGDVLSASPAFSRDRSLVLESLRLSGNPWTCDCKSISWVREWLKEVKRKWMELMVRRLSLINNYNNTLVDEEIQEVNRLWSDIRESRCRKSRKSLLDVFRKELRDCRRSGGSPGPALGLPSFAQKSYYVLVYLLFVLPLALH